MNSSSRRLMIVSMLLASAFFAASSESAVPVSRAVRIMPMGDSITTGLCDGRGATTCNTTVTTSCTADPSTVNPNASGYRPYLKQALNHMGMNSDFVGSQTHPKGGSSYPTNHFSDPQHEGHGGWSISQMTGCADATTGHWFANINPDVILLHIGTNDALYCRNSGYMRDDLVSLLTRIYASLPATTKVVVATLIPISHPGVNPSLNCLNGATPESTVQAFNQLIPSVVSSQQRLGRSVSMIDMHARLTTSDLTDGIHPSTVGYQKMADGWAAALFSSGSQTESVTAYGKLWAFDKNGNYIGQSAISAIPRYNANICSGNPLPCTFDTRTFVALNGVQFESITAYGKFWNFDMSGGLLSSGQLNAVPRYSSLICAGQPAPCKFDTRTFQTIADPTGDLVVESITAYGKFWNFDLAGNLLGTGTLPSVTRYNTSICSGRPTPCKFDTRTVVTAVGDLQVESIIGYGNYWNFNTNGLLRSQGTLISVPKYQASVCYGLTSPCTFNTRAYQANQ